MDYSITRLRLIAENYEELRCYAYDGGFSYWRKLSGEPGLTNANWTRVIDSLADFDRAVDHFGKRWKLEEMQVDGTVRWMGWELREFADYLNGGK